MRTTCPSNCDATQRREPARRAGFAVARVWILLALCDCTSAIAVEREWDIDSFLTAYDQAFGEAKQAWHAVELSAELRVSQVGESEERFEVSAEFLGPAWKTIRTDSVGRTEVNVAHNFQSFSLYKPQDSDSFEIQLFGEGNQAFQEANRNVFNAELANLCRASHMVMDESVRDVFHDPKVRLRRVFETDGVLTVTGEMQATGLVKGRMFTIDLLVGDGFAVRRFTSAPIDATEVGRVVAGEINYDGEVRGTPKPLSIRLIWREAAAAEPFLTKTLTFNSFDPNAGVTDADFSLGKFGLIAPEIAAGEPSPRWWIWAVALLGAYGMFVVVRCIRAHGRASPVHKA